MQLHKRSLIKWHVQAPSCVDVKLWSYLFVSFTFLLSWPWKRQRLFLHVHVKTEQRISTCNRAAVENNKAGVFV